MSRNTERAERRTAEINTRRQQRKELRKNSADFDSGRRRFLKLGVGTVLGLAATAGAIDAVRKLIESGKSDQDLILGEARRLGIFPDSDEQQLWQNSYQNTPEYLSPESSGTEFDNRLYGTLRLMQSSKNNNFKNASNDLHDMVKAGRVKIYKLAKWQGDMTAGVAFAVNESGNFEYELNISPDFVLNGSTALTLAGLLTHEVWHIRRFEEHLGSNTGLLPEEQVTALEEFMGSSKQSEIEEAFAYGREADAYIYQAGLMGALYGVEASGEENRAAKYIQLGSDSNNPGWREYIVSIGATH